jgi:hypothetical protein
VLRRVAISSALAVGGAAAFVGVSFPVALQLQNRALDKCSAHLDAGVVSVHWKTVLPPHYVCAVNGREVKHLPPIR